MKSSNSAKLLKFCKAGNLKKIKELLFNPEINLDINYQDINGNSSLIWACRNGNEAVVRLLLLGNKSKENIPFDVTNYVENHNKKHFIFNNNSKSGLNTSIENVSINMTNIHGNTALTWACREGYTDIVNLLLAHGADPTIKNNMNYKALVYACKNGHTDIVKILLNRHEENKEELGINLKSGTYHYTSLIYACKLGDEEMTIQLLENGADVNAQTIDGDTALIWACKNQHQKIVEILLHYHALTYLKNNRGFTAFSWALYKKNKTIFKILHDNLFESLLSSSPISANPSSPSYSPSVIINDKGALNYITPPLTPQMTPTIPMSTLSLGSPSNNIIFSNIPTTAIENSSNPDDLKNNDNSHNNSLVPRSTTTFISNSNLNGINNNTTTTINNNNDGNNEIQSLPMSSLSFTLPKNNSQGNKITSYSCQTTQVVSTTTLTTTKLSFSFNNDISSVNADEPLIVSKIEETSNKRSSLLLENIKNKNMNIELTSSQSKIEVGDTSPNSNIAIVTKNVDGKVNFSNSLNRMIINLGRSSSQSSSEENFINRTFSYNRYGNRNMAITNADKNNSGASSSTNGINIDTGSMIKKSSSSCIDQNSEKCFSIMKREYFLSIGESSSSLPCLSGFMEYIQNKEKRVLFRKKATKFSLYENENDNIDLIEKLIDYGVNISNRLFSGCTPLIISCIFGQEKFFQFLIEQNVDVNVPNSENWTALMVASQNCQLKMVQQLLQQNADTNFQNNYQETALIIASKEGHFEVVNFLLKFFSKINNKDNFGDAALIAACRGGHIKIVKLLLENNADVNLQNNYGETAVMVATKYNNLDIVQLLLDFNANIDMQNMNGWTALSMASYYGHETIVKYLIKHKADIAIKTKDGKTAYDIAVKRHLSNITQLLEEAERYRKEKKEKNRNDSEEEQEYLFSSESEWDSDSDSEDETEDKNKSKNDNDHDHDHSIGIGIEDNSKNTSHGNNGDGMTLKDNDSVTPVLFSRTTEIGTQTSPQMDTESNSDVMDGFSGDGSQSSIKESIPVVVDTIHKNSNDFNCSKNNSYDSNGLGDSKGNITSVKSMKKSKNEKRKRHSFHIDDSIGITLYKKIGWNRLHMICMNGDIKQLLYLIEEENIDLSERTVDGWSALHIAVSSNKVEVVKCLLDHGVDKNIENEGYTPLYIASQNGFNDIVKLLVEYHANIDQVTKGWSPIQIACSNGHYQTVDYLLSVGANIHLKSAEEYKLLHIATEENNLYMVELLLNEGHINVNAKDSSGWTALHIVARENYYGLAKYLIKFGHADVDEEDRTMNTPLHIASQYGNHTITQLLIHSKANINFKNLNGWTPLHMACQNEHTEVVRDLLENDAKVNLTTQDSKTALHLACENDNRHIIQLLIDHQANINLATFDGWTPLHFAVYYNNPVIVQYLLENHPVVNKKTKEGFSVLDIAIKIKNEDIIKLLIDYFLAMDEKN